MTIVGKAGGLEQRQKQSERRAKARTLATNRGREKVHSRFSLPSIEFYSRHDFEASFSSSKVVRRARV